MAKVREILGHVSVETAKAKRICYRNRRSHSIAKGEACLVIREPASGGSKNYCVPCATAILGRAVKDLSALRHALSVEDEEV